MVIDLVVTAPSGLHARPAANLVKTVQQFQSKATLRWQGGSADAASILDVLRLGIPAGSRVQVMLEGADAAAMADALRRLEQDHFEQVVERGMPDDAAG